MQDPYLILGLLSAKTEGTLDDEQVKAAYQQLLKQYPPEREPQRFQQIRKAYEQLATRKDRVNYALFELNLPDREDLAAILLPKAGKLTRPSLQQVQNLLRQS